MYQYKGVPVPPLGMIDNIISVKNMDQTTIMNKIINTLMDHKNLKLSEKKSMMQYRRMQKVLNIWVMLYSKTEQYKPQIKTGRKKEKESWQKYSPSFPKFL